MQYLVREDILDLTQLLIQSSGSGNGRNVIFGIVHLDIPVDK